MTAARRFAIVSIVIGVWVVILIGLIYFWLLANTPPSQSI